MVTPIAVNYEALTTAVRREIIDTYQHQSLLGLFPSDMIPDGIAAEEWAQKYIKETKRAAIHRRGYNPNKITMDFSGFSLRPITVDQEAVLTEVDLAQFAKNGMLSKIVPELGKNMEYTTNTAVMAGEGGNGESFPISAQYNWLLEPGTGNGTAARPIPIYDESGGAWNTHATMRSDIAKWIGGYGTVANEGNSLVLCPKAAKPTIKEIKSEYNDHNIEFYIRNQGVRDIIYVEDEFFPTAADAAPTKDLFDMLIFDPSEYAVGYQRTETVTAGPGTFPDRNYYMQGEVWFCFLPIPLRKNEAGTIKTYKHMGRIKDITTS